MLIHRVDLLQNKTPVPNWKCFDAKLKTVLPTSIVLTNELYCEALCCLRTASKNATHCLT